MQRARLYFFAILGSHWCLAALWCFVLVLGGACLVLYHHQYSRMRDVDAANLPSAMPDAHNPFIRLHAFRILSEDIVDLDPDDEPYAYYFPVVASDAPGLAELKDLELPGVILEADPSRAERYKAALKRALPEVKAILRVPPEEVRVSGVEAFCKLDGRDVLEIFADRPDIETLEAFRKAYPHFTSQNVPRIQVHEKFPIPSWCGVFLAAIGTAALGYCLWRGFKDVRKSAAEST